MVISTIQRRYDLSSIQAGLIVSVFDMAVIISVLFVSYFGGKGHKPRWLGFGLLVQGLGMYLDVWSKLMIFKDQNNSAYSPGISCIGFNCPGISWTVPVLPDLLTLSQVPLLSREYT